MTHAEAKAHIPPPEIRTRRLRVSRDPAARDLYRIHLEPWAGLPRHHLGSLFAIDGFLLFDAEGDYVEAVSRWPWVDALFDLLARRP